MEENTGQVATGAENPESGQEFNVESILGSQKAESPQMPEGFDQDAFNANLATVSGGKYNSFDQIAELESYRDKYNKIEPEYQSLVEKSSINPFANNLMEKANAMFAEGKDVQDIVRFMEVQGLDTSSLSNEDAIKRSKQLSTGWSAEKVNKWFNLEYPPIDPDSETADVEKTRREFALDEAAMEATKTLESMKVDITANQTDTSAQDEARQAYQTNMGKLSTAVIAQIDTIPFKANVAKDLDYELNWNVPKDDPRMEAVAQAVQMTAMQQNIKLDKHGLPQIQAIAQNAIQAMFLPEIINAIVVDAHASITEAKEKENSNSGPVTKGSGGVKKAKPSGPAPVVNRNGTNFV